MERRAEIRARFASVRWHVAAKRSKVKAMTEGKLKEATRALEKAKAQARAYVEHPFHVVKNLFRHRKVRYRGLAQNTAQLHTLFALANLVLVQRTLRARKSRLESPQSRVKGGQNRTRPSARTRAFDQTAPAFLAEDAHAAYPFYQTALISGSLALCRVDLGGCLF